MKILYISGDADETTLQRDLNAFSAFLPKPFTFQEFFTKVHSLLKPSNEAS
jgi:DNA-binding response OmpR family regulator